VTLLPQNVYGVSSFGVRPNVVEDGLPKLPQRNVVHVTANGSVASEGVNGVPNGSVQMDFGGSVQ
jgi:hypothetical protein